MPRSNACATYLWPEKEPTNTETSYRTTSHHSYVRTYDRIRKSLGLLPPCQRHYPPTAATVNVYRHLSNYKFPKSNNLKPTSEKTRGNKLRFIGLIVPKSPFRLTKRPRSYIKTVCRIVPAQVAKVRYTV